MNVLSDCHKKSKIDLEQMFLFHFDLGRCRSNSGHLVQGLLSVFFFNILFRFGGYFSMLHHCINSGTKFRLSECFIYCCLKTT
jgi:hypothetical protein